jgi:hypothetical protein
LSRLILRSVPWVASTLNLAINLGRIARALVSYRGDS